MKSPKHILIISLHADPMLPAGIGEYGGGHMYPYELLTGLSKENFKVSLITRKYDSSLPDVDSVNGFTTIYRIDYGNFTFHDKRDFYRLRDVSLSLTCSLLNQHNIKPDLIHSLYWNSGYLAMQLSQKLYIPYVHSPISVGAVIKKKKTKDIEPHRIDTEQLVFENAAVILSITESERKDIISHYGIAKEKIAIIGRPVAKEYLYPVHDGWGNARNEDMQYIHSPFPTDRHPMHPDENWWEKKAFVYVGRIHHNKGIHHIINAWIMLKEQYAEECPPLWIVGGTPAEINKFHIEHNLHLNLYEKNGSIIWWGRLNAEGISSLYTRALTLVMHSKYEPGGRVSIEAMCAALPVIATPYGFAADTIMDWHTGFLVDYGNEQKLAKRMSMFILQPYLADSMGYNAKIVALSLARKWNFMEHHINVYNRLISNVYLTHNEETDMIQNQWVWGIVNSYPTGLPEISDEYLLQKLAEAGINDISEIHKDDMGATEYFIWHLYSGHKVFSVLQPYNRINIKRLLDTSRYSKIISASSVYTKFKEWRNIFPSPVLFLDDEKQIIVMKPYDALEQNVEHFTDIIGFISHYKHNASYIRTDSGKFILKELPVCEKTNWGQPYVELFPKEDFSIAAEAGWVLSRIKECFLLKDVLPPLFIAHLTELTVIHSPENIVLGGFVHPNSFCYCEDKICLLTPENLHLVENGYDEGQLLLLMTSDHTEKDFWSCIIHKIPEQTQKNAVLWAMILLAKKILLHHIMYDLPEKTDSLLTQLALLLEFVSLK